MRSDLSNPVKLADAPCGCERYEVDTTSGRGTVCLHTCGQNQPPRGKRLRDPSLPPLQVRGEAASAKPKRSRSR